MKDIRPRALERARQKAEERKQTPGETAGGSTGSGFESERERAKQALREEVNTYRGQSVRKIAATGEKEQEERILRVKRGEGY